jgi:large subunit ribosomal protein L5
MTRLEQHYKEVVVPRLRSELGIDNVMAVPRLLKITINMGVGEAAADKKALDAAVADLTLLSGQKPLITKARRAVASFKIREGWPIGCKVTLRRQRMYEFLDRFITIAAPRIRDFRGLSPRGFDGRGNYNMGLSEQIIFPEIDFDKVDKMRGMDVSFSATAINDEHGRALLAAFNFPFRG